MEGACLNDVEGIGCITEGVYSPARKVITVRVARPSDVALSQTCFPRLRIKTGANTLRHVNENKGLNRVSLSADAVKPGHLPRIVRWV
jgi:hypothetical protein